jgi:hypothetical protein
MFKFFAQLICFSLVGSAAFSAVTTPPPAPLELHPRLFYDDTVLLNYSNPPTSNIEDVAPSGDVLLSFGVGGAPVVVGQKRHLEFEGLFFPRFVLGGRAVLTSTLKGFDIYDSTTKKLLKIFKLYPLAVFANGTKAVAHEDFKSIVVVNLETGKIEARLKKWIEWSDVGVRFSQDESHLAVFETAAGTGSDQRIFRVADWQMVHEFDKWGAWMDFSKNGTRVVFNDGAPNAPRQPTVYDSSTGATICKYATPGGYEAQLVGTTDSHFILYFGHGGKPGEVRVISFKDCSTAGVAETLALWQPRQVADLGGNRLLVTDGTDLLLLDLNTKVSRFADSFKYEGSDWYLLSAYVRSFADQFYVVAIKQHGLKAQVLSMAIDF